MQLVLILVMLLVPIIPAAILFAFLPKGKSEGTIRGKFDGYHVKFGGAFAGYMAVLVFGTKILMPSIIKETDYHWEITGYIDQRDGTFDPRHIQIQAQPPGHVVGAAGQFSMIFKTNREELDTLPVIQVDIPNVDPNSKERYNHVTALLLKEDDTRSPGIGQPIKMIRARINKQKRTIELLTPINIDRVEGQFQPDKSLAAQSGQFGTAGVPR